jgi:IS5 family transposase
VLAELDLYLDDPVLFVPFRAYFHPSHGRPSVPMETYVRMMVLKYRYRPVLKHYAPRSPTRSRGGCSAKCLPGAAVLRRLTLEKTTSRCGAGAVEQLNQALLKC